MKLQPINRKPCIYWQGIKITENKNTQGFRVIGGKNRKLIQQLNSRLLQAEECMRHKLDYALYTNRYRLYRRGKNRCKNCGVKLFTKLIDDALAKEQEVRCPK